MLKSHRKNLAFAFRNYPTPTGGSLVSPCSILLCSSRDGTESKILPQRLHFKPRGWFDPLESVLIYSWIWGCCS